MEKYLRSDLALELNEEIEDSSIDNGIEIKNIDNYNGKIRESIIYIKNSIGAELLGKPVGTYITIEGDELCKEDEDVHQLFSQCLRDNLDKLLKGSKKILVVGMGNRFVTPDALGPYVVDNLFFMGRH